MQVLAWTQQLAIQGVTALTWLRPASATSTIISPKSSLLRSRITPLLMFGLRNSLLRKHTIYDNRLSWRCSWPRAPMPATRCWSTACTRRATPRCGRPWRRAQSAHCSGGREGLLLGLGGGVLELVLGAWAGDFLAGAFPVAVPGIEAIRFDLAAGGFTVAVAAISGVLLGAPSALRLMSGRRRQAGRSGLQSPRHGAQSGDGARCPAPELLRLMP